MKLYNINNHINYSSTKIQIFLFANEQSVHNYVKSNVNKLKQKQISCVNLYIKFYANIKILYENYKGAMIDNNLSKCYNIE